MCNSVLCKDEHTGSWRIIFKKDTTTVSLSAFVEKTNLLGLSFSLRGIFRSGQVQVTISNAFFIEEYPLMFLGPGQRSAGISEVFLLPTPSSGLASATCTVPTYPMTDIEGSVGFVHDGYLQICGKVTPSLSLSN